MLLAALLEDIGSDEVDHGWGLFLYSKQFNRQTVPIKIKVFVVVDILNEFVYHRHFLFD